MDSPQCSKTEPLQLTKEYLEELLAFHVKHFSKYDYSKKSFEFFFDSENYEVFGIVKNKNILSYVIFSHILDEGDIVFVGTDPEYRSRGFASMLLNIPHVRFCVNQIFLEVSVTNKNAIDFYLKNDFQIISVRKKYFSQFVDKDSDAYLMCKRY